jgi:hypothetical protein
MEKVNFLVGDTVKCGLNGGMGKIVELIHPLGTYAVYKVQLFNDGKIFTLEKHELVKGLPDDLMMFNSDMYNQLIVPKKTIQVQTSNLKLFETSSLDTLNSSKLDNLVSDTSSPLPKKVNKSALPN